MKKHHFAEDAVREWTVIIMFILYHKELYIIPEALTKNRTMQTWRGKQIAMCDDREELEKYRQTMKRPDDYYIEEQPNRE